MAWLLFMVRNGSYPQALEDLAGRTHKEVRNVCETFLVGRRLRPDARSVLASVNPAPAQAIVSPEADSTTRLSRPPRCMPSYGQLPLLFIENRGQTDRQVAFTLQAGAATVFFTPTGVTYALAEPG